MKYLVVEWDNVKQSAAGDTWDMSYTFLWWIENKQERNATSKTSP